MRIDKPLQQERLDIAVSLKDFSKSMVSSVGGTTAKCLLLLLRVVKWVSLLRFLFGVYHY